MMRNNRIDPDGTPFQELQQKPLSQLALELLRDAIISGRMMPDQALKDSEIAQQMGISRVPIREALIVLENEGLVERRPRRGTFVTRHSRLDVEELYSLRSTLEAFGVQLLVKNLSEQDLRQLTDILSEMEIAAEHGSWSDVNEQDMRFHEALMTLSGHHLLLTIWQRLKLQTRRVLAMAHTPDVDLMQIVRNHTPIMEALRSRGAQASVEAIQEHIIDSGRRAIAHWAVAQEQGSRE